MSSDGNSRLVIPIRQWGSAAAKTFARAGDGAVIAVFDTAFYCRFGRRMICIGPAGFARGPMNIETERIHAASWKRFGITPGLAARCAHQRLCIGDVEFPATDAFIWQPAPTPAYRVENLRRGTALAAATAAARAPADSAASVWQAPIAAGEQLMTVEDALRRELAAGCAELTHWLAALVRRPERAEAAARGWTRLIGLGRGLTPSGDDLLGGAMVALSVYGAEAVRQSLAKVVCREMHTRTSPISAAHLQLAAAGQGGEALHTLITALMGGQGPDIEAAITGLERVGHTSGWDMLAGVLLATRAVCTTAPDKDCIAAPSA